MAGYGQDAREVLEGWAIRRVLNVFYFLLVEHMTNEQREEVDAILADPRDAGERSKRAVIARLGGGEVQ